MSKQSPPQLPDDDQLQQYLAGDSSFSRAYRDESREVTPPELDHAVLQMAQAAVPRRRRASRWQLPLALAATLLIGVPLVWDVTRQAPQMEVQSVAGTADVQVQAAATATSVPDAAAGAERASAGDREVASGAVASRQAKAAPQTASPARAPAAVAASPAPEAAAELATAPPHREMDDAAAGQRAPALALQSLMAPSGIAEGDAMASSPTQDDASAEDRVPSRYWGLPAGWNLTQSRDGRYQAGVDREAPYAGTASAVLQGDSGHGWVELSQDLPVAPYRGLRLRLRGFLRPDLQRGLAQLWLRAGPVDAVHVAGQIDASAAVVNGVRGWRRVDVVVDVPADAEALSVGVLLFDGDGEIHVDQLSLVEVPPGLTAEDADRGGQPPLPQPRNAGFEAPVSR
jgi:hypothetical protein